MDSLFLLSPEARLYFLQTEARTLGCAYICLWYYLPHPSNCLISKDGWYNEDDRQPSSSSGSYKMKLFEDYKDSYFSVESGCVPGLAFMQGLPYIQLEDSNLMNSASNLAQLEFYKEAGIKNAVFIGCNSGEIELGSLTSINANMQMLFNNDFMNFQRSQTQLGDHLVRDQNILSSSSTSSLKSLSVGSPEYTSFILSNPVTDQPGSDQAFKQGKTLPPHHQITMDSYNFYRNLLLPSPQSDDAALARAMLAVISSSRSDLQQQEESRMNQTSTSFEPFRRSISTSFESNFRLDGQRMIKKSISLLKYAEARRHEKLPMSSSNLHHVITERKRRERINESLRDLRMLLPPGSKKDYVTVLSKTKEYLRTLKAQINKLEEKNKKLEMQLKSKKQAVQVTGSNERVEVQIIRASESTSEYQQINILIIVREEANMIELLLKVLECLKGMGIMNLITIDASSNPTTASLTLQVQAGDWDADSLKQALTMAILDADKDTP